MMLFVTVTELSEIANFYSDNNLLLLNNANSKYVGVKDSFY